MTPPGPRPYNIAARLKMLRYDSFQAGALHTGLLAETQAT
jgi:hypothetical protein